MMMFYGTSDKFNAADRIALSTDTIEHIIQLHQGSLTFASHYGKGSKAIIILPYQSNDSSQNVFYLKK